MTAPTRLMMGGLSHPGLVRGENEDCIATRSDLGLAVLADGMGGHQAGEVASRMAIDVIADSFSQAAARDVDGVAGAIQKANAAIHQAAQARPDYKGMGSTVVVTLFHDDHLYIGHVGDSRLYRLRAGALEPLTRDHSVVQELVNRGLFTAEEARQSLAKNLVTRALGVDPTIEVETGETEVQEGDTYLLCSDGLTDVVMDDQITRILRDAAADVDTAARRLVERANSNGGPDNVSVILVHVGK